MKYSNILSLSLEHPYYLDGRCQDFRIEPSTKTRQLLRNHRCFLRSGPDRVRVLMAFTASDQPLLPFESEATLLFHLMLRSENFAFVTDLSGVVGKPAPLYTNIGTKDDRGKLQLVNRANQPLGHGIFADVEIHTAGLGCAGESSVFREFQVLFRARQSRWAYYCVTHLQYRDELNIVEAMPGGDGCTLVFSDENRRELNSEPDPSDPVARQLAKRYPGKRRVRFLSNQAVECRQVPGKHLELRRGGERLAGPLPLPSARNHSRFEMRPPGAAASSAGASQDFLYQVVHYLNQPSPQLGE